MFRRGAKLRPLRASRADPAIRLALTDPLTHTLPGARLVEVSGLRMPEEFSTMGPETAPTGVLWHGVNIAPITDDPRTLERFARSLAARPRRASSIVGPTADVERMWQHMAPSWAPARELRWHQPLLLADADPQVTADPALRPAAPREDEIVFPASVAMFREEVGTDPTSHDRGRGYRARVKDLIAHGRTYVLIRDGAVVFKADVGAIFGDVAQIHGVWVEPELRGHGIARRAMVAVVEQVRRDHAPQVSLYVNDYNQAARRAYAAAGFRPVGELATILF
ncbi:MAG: GNAT family N-acetyltransferase [Brachybacterium sp.]|nr:GNAT family N-acetyltransferase [Brachybacterium sp.]